MARLWKYETNIRAEGPRDHASGDRDQHAGEGARLPLWRPLPEDPEADS